MGGQRHVLNDHSLATTIASTAWSLTVGKVSNRRPLAGSSCLGPGTEIGGSGDAFVFMANTVLTGARSTPTTGTISSGKILNRSR